MSRLLLLAVLLTAPLAAAQAFDASLPDASVGEGGADQSSEENDPNASACLSSGSCEGGFTCVKGRCVPGGTRNATGCAVAPTAALVATALLLARRRASRGSL